MALGASGSRGPDAHQGDSQLQPSPLSNRVASFYGKAG